MMAQIKIVTDSLVGHKAHVYYIDEDGTETSLDGVVCGADIHLDVNEINKVTLYGYYGRGEIVAQLQEFVVYKVPPVPPDVAKPWEEA